MSRPTSRCLLDHCRTEAMCPGIALFMIHGEDATVTVDGCNCCRARQLKATRAHSLKGEFTRIQQDVFV